MSRGGQLFYLDSNVLIQAKNQYYRFENFPSFWEWIKKKCEDGKIKTSKIVLDELLKGKDELSKWVSVNWIKEGAPEPSENAQKTFVEIADSVIAEYPTHEVNRFLAGADPWVIAQAKDEDAIVVTHEVLVPDSSRKIKIPNICKLQEVDYVDIFTMLGQLGFKS